MRKDFLPFSRPSITEDDIAAVTAVLRSGWLTTGRKNTDFEEHFCKYTGCRHAVALASATAGMHLTLKAFDIKPGDEVVTPSLTWVSTVNLIVLAGARPVFADIDRDTLMVSARTLEPCMGPHTRLVLPVHFAGAPADMDPICDLARRKNLSLIEDTAHALGTFYKGRHVGSDGTAIFSFHPIKNITAGEGGMVCTDNADFANRIRRLKFHGLGVDAFDRRMQGRAPQAEVIEPGFKYNLTDVAAALGLSQLARVDTLNGKRADLTRLYRERLAGVTEILPLADPPYDHRHSRHLFIVRLDTDKAGITRDVFMDELRKRNIGTGLHFRAVHLQKYYTERMGMRRGLLPNTEWNSDRICSLPLFPDMTPEDVNDVVSAIKEVLAR